MSRERTAAAGLTAHFEVGDFLKDDPPQPFDLIFEHTLFCAIDPADRDEYARAVLRWLRPDGDYLAVNYMIPDRDGPPPGGFDLLHDWFTRRLVEIENGDGKPVTAEP